AIDARLGEQIAVAIANFNSCEYCLAAHTALGRKAGASASEMEAAQRGSSEDPKTAAILAFALNIVKNRGQGVEVDISNLRRLQVSDEIIAEVLAHVALNVFTNYVNLVFDVPLDFPRINLRK
ncbi:MAG TPA: carboxymuconolactone decarboxylase family protein, partial [Oligoflexus sp.]|uniref:carboxymuconolactone decarboxylase family protein n=1 Tax=Oligoflexus sp. TaxID=1971216 RepID=UPI002D3717D3